MPEPELPPPSMTPLDTEPVRLPVWAATLLVTLVNVGIDLLTDVGWKPALVGALVTLGGLLGAGEFARSRSFSPQTVRQVEVRAERDGYRQGVHELAELGAAADRAKTTVAKRSTSGKARRVAKRKS